MGERDKVVFSATSRDSGRCVRRHETSPAGATNHKEGQVLLGVDALIFLCCNFK